MISRQTRAYKHEDPTTKHQKALPPEVYRFRLRTARTDREKARATLLAAALFFALRSCEYTKVPRKDQKTRPLRPKDIIFRQGNREVPHHNPEIFKAETVAARFGPQKTGVWDDEIPMFNNGERRLNPVPLWATVITRLRSYPGYDDEWPVFTYYSKRTKRFIPITNNKIARDIKSAVKAVGKDVLGFGPEETGTHSNRSALAMQLYLQGVPPYIIMLIGRWRSDAFLAYIEKQCREFTRGISKIMLNLNTFYHLPSHRGTTTEETDRNETNDKKQKSINETPRYRRTHRGNAHFIHYGRLHALQNAKPACTPASRRTSRQRTYGRFVDGSSARPRPEGPAGGKG